MNDIYINWEPLKDIPRVLYCEGIHDDYEGFRILLVGEDERSPILRIKFDSARSYKNSDEGDLLKTIASINNPGRSSLFLVENSSWIKWFHEETYGIHKNKNFKHFAIYTPNDCIDVMSEFAPIVEWLNL
ncbi:MAG: hypothetical protein WC757_04285 [Candidatus Paceibacterota bacterium]|jgi:hypothetical protein